MRNSFLGVSAAAMLAGLLSAAGATPAFAQDAQAKDEQDGIPEIVVTAQKREESLQDVPLAVTSLSEESLKSRGVSGAEDLRTQVPNLSFSRTTVDNFNVQIRGIGTPLVDPSADSAVGIHVNNVPLTTSRIGDTDFFDVERVEVLRGPQGTLYGRNATAGVVNVITAKPKRDFSASLTAGMGNYGEMKFTGYVNAPLGNMFSLRAAGYYLSREGYSQNTFTGNDADDRKLWATRLTLGFEPASGFRSYLMWEHFYENDRRQSSSRLACTPDPGPATVGGVATNPVTRGLLSQGCLPGSLYSPAALGAPNTLGTIEGIIGLLTGTINNNFNAGVSQSTDYRQFASAIDPKYRARNDLVELNLEWDVAPGLQFSSLTSYSEDHSYRRAAVPTHIPTNRFNTTALTPGGVLSDPQLGSITFPQSFQIIKNDTTQWTQELRLQSDFDGPINFNVGGIYIDYETEADFYLVTSSFNLLSRVQNLGGAGIYIDPNPEPDGTGHNYLRNYRPYHLEAKAAFGELYYRPVETLTLTLGLRYTDDLKRGTDYPSMLLQPGRGLVAGAQLEAQFQEVTGRFNIDWKPDLGFTDSSMFYLSASRGYKGGGFNQPAAAALVNVPATYRPEFVNALEGGMKNTLFDGRLVFNATAFYYDYKGFQISKFANLIPVNENVDASVYGAEIETIIQPVRNLRLNATLGLLHSEIGNSSSIDLLNRTQGDPTLTLVKSTQANCVISTTSAAAILTAINAGTLPASALVGVCGGALAGSFGAVPTAGRAANLKGNELPNAPKWTLSVGAQYRLDISTSWSATLRGDYYQQGRSFNRIYNSPVDLVKGWRNLNLSLRVAHEPSQFDVNFYIRNVTDEQAILSGPAAGLNDINGLGTSLFVNAPRTYGMSLTKRF
ncbi:TonB-dependent receptor [Sphingomonas sp. AOB5]|uniref:TonB-dependent receptor n=1 Tax=Sphingomonas sp. AOB5 TaxID=3034017 RepID=UPI0023F8F54E|nr:TonB-dependent receptor [Sphingomonas sp. AOB5]MDF7775615.1 TonB-dependent receptor [Sphingomonas sp. AOB5]